MEVAVAADLFAQAAESHKTSGEQPEKYDNFLELVDIYWKLPGALGTAIANASQANGWRQLAAVDILGRVPVSASAQDRLGAVEALLRVLYGCNDDALAAAVVSAIGGLGDEVALPALVQAASSETADVREAVAGALATTITDPLDDTTKLTLLYLLRDDSPEVRDWAAFCFGNSTEWDSEEVRTALRELCVDAEPDVREEAIRALAQRGDPAAVSFLKLMIADPEVSDLVVEAAGEAADLSLFPSLLGLQASGATSMYLPAALIRTDPNRRAEMLVKEEDLTATMRLALAEVAAENFVIHDVRLQGGFPQTRLQVSYSKSTTDIHTLDLGRIWSLGGLDTSSPTEVAKTKLQDLFRTALS